jgi:molybdopterin molybdotransferase
MAVSIEEARAAVLECAKRLDSEEVSLDDALGRVLAVDARAPDDVPPSAASAGEDIHAGELVVEAGSVCGPAELGVLAAMNIPHPRVVRRPRVAIAGTGDELTDPGTALKPGEIRDSNGPALGGAVHRAGGELVTRLRVGDDLEATVSMVRAGLRDVDVLITTGGVSVGPHDHVRSALQRLGVREVFAGVRMKPGGPTTFAVGQDGALVFALPGNPVSALVGFRLFVVPALDAMLGRETVVHPITAIADEELAGATGRTRVVRCRTTLHDDGWHVRPTTSQESHILSSMLGVDALALVPADRGQIATGEPVEIELVA